MSVTLKTDHLSSFISEAEFENIAAQAGLAQQLLVNGAGAGSDFTGWVNLPDNYDREEFERVKAAAAKIREDSDILLVAGIGGSYLGARAVIEMLGSEFFDEFSPLRIYFIGEDLSADRINRLMALCDGKRISVNVISKSGTTTETSVAFRFLRRMMEGKYGVAGAAERIYATTDRTSGKLHELSVREGYEMFTVPGDIGGRYSVLTSVGLLPIAAAGFDIDALMRGAANGKAKFCESNLFKNDAVKYAAARRILANKGKEIEIMASFEPNYRMFGEWYKQLFGESEGKDQKGIFPASVVYSTDLHSMGQFIQDGSRNLFETMVSFKKPVTNLEVFDLEEDFDGLNYLAGKTVSEINDAAMKATQMAHVAGGVPVIEIAVDEIDEENVGELIYFFETACAVSGYMSGVNPFDQPGVEGYKKNMFKILGKPGY